jgi:hypothetical protein
MENFMQSVMADPRWQQGLDMMGGISPQQRAEITVREMQAQAFQEQAAQRKQDAEARKFASTLGGDGFTQEEIIELYNRSPEVAEQAIKMMEMQQSARRQSNLQDLAQKYGGLTPDYINAVALQDPEEAKRLADVYSALNPENESTTAMQTLQQKAQAIQAANPNLSYEQAFNIAADVVRVSPPDAYGNVGLINTADFLTNNAPSASAPPTGLPSAFDVDLGSVGQESETLPPIQGLVGLDTPQGIDPTSAYGFTPWLQENLQRASGAIPAPIKSALSPITGALSDMGQELGVTQDQSKVTQSRTQAKALQQQFIEALSISGKPPLAEQERIQSILPSMGAFESPERAQDIYGALLPELESAYRANAEVANSRSVTEAERVEARNKMRAGERLINKLRQNNLPQAEGEQDFNAMYESLPSGSIFTAPDGTKRRKP